MLREEVIKTYGNRLRIRVCGILRIQNGILTVGSTLEKEDTIFWSPPGGGLEFGESLTDALKREFREELNITITVGDLVCVHEHLELPLHAVELFYEVTSQEVDKMRLGIDPEEADTPPTLRDISVITAKDLENNAQNKFHPILFQLLNKK